MMAQDTPLKVAQDAYNAEVNNYRAVYKQFQVDKTAYQQSASNINQEIMVMSVKKLLSSQAQVWLKYFAAMSLDGTVTSGQNPEWEATGSALIQKQADFENKISQYEQITDKPGAEAALTSANTETKELKLLSARTIALIKFFRAQYALKELNGFKDKLTELIPLQIMNQPQKESQMRALAEAERLLGTAQTNYDTAYSAYQKAPASSGEYLLDKTNENLTKIYKDLDKAMRILKEASSGIEI